MFIHIYTKLCVYVMYEFSDYLENTLNVKNRSNISITPICKIQETLKIECCLPLTCPERSWKLFKLYIGLVYPQNMTNRDDAFKVILLHPKLLAFLIICIIYMYMFQK